MKKVTIKVVFSIMGISLALEADTQTCMFTIGRPAEEKKTLPLRVGTVKGLEGTFYIACFLFREENCAIFFDKDAENIYSTGNIKDVKIELVSINTGGGAYFKKKKNITGASSLKGIPLENQGDSINIGDTNLVQVTGVSGVKDGDFVSTKFVGRRIAAPGKIFYNVGTVEVDGGTLFVYSLTKPEQ